MLQFQQLALALIKTGAGVSGICSSVGLGAGLYGVGHQCYIPVLISRQFQQLAPALINTGASCRANAVLLGWALDLAESGANAIARYLSRDGLSSWRWSL